MKLSSEKRRLVLCALIAAVIAYAATPSVLLLIGARKASWVSITLATDPPPDAALMADIGGETILLPVSWDLKGTANFIYIEPEAELELIGILADGQAIDLSRLRIDARWKRSATGDRVVIPTVGLLELPSSPLELSISVAAKRAASVRMLWRGLDYRSAVQPGTELKIALASLGRVGWVLLPPESFKRLTLLTNGAECRAEGYDVRIVHFGTHRMPSKNIDVTGLNYGKSREKKPKCALELQQLDKLTVPGKLQAISIFAVILALFTGTLWWCANKLIRPGWPGHDQKDGVDRRNAKSSPISPEGWLWTRVGTASIAALGAVAYHIAFLLIVPFDYSPDSRGYYTSAHAMVLGYGLNGNPSIRPPGYAMIIAATIRVFGDHIWGIIATQHLLLAALGPIVAWFLHPRLGARSALGFGSLAGIAPWLAITGNVIWTDAIFAFLSTVAALALVSAADCAGGRFIRWLAAGLLVGCAILVRPTGLMLLAGLPLALYVAVLRRNVKADWIRWIAIRATAVLVGSAAIVAPWVAHLYERERIFPAIAIYNDLGRDERILWPTSLNMMAWYIPVIFQKRVPPDDEIQTPLMAFAHGWYSGAAGFRESEGVPKHILNDTTYPSEVVRAAIRHNPVDYLRSIFVALAYNITLILPDPSEVVWTEVWGFFVRFLTVPTDRPPDLPFDISTQMDREIALTPHPGWDGSIDTVRNVERFLKAKTEETRWNANRLLVFLMLGPSFVAKKAWGILVFLAFVSVVYFWRHRSNRGAAVIWLYVGGVIAYLSAAAFGSDRYVAVLEPLLYVLAGFGFKALSACIRGARA